MGKCLHDGDCGLNVLSEGEEDDGDDNDDDGDDDDDDDGDGEDADEEDDDNGSEALFPEPLKVCRLS